MPKGQKSSSLLLEILNGRKAWAQVQVRPPNLGPNEGREVIALARHWGDHHKSDPFACPRMLTHLRNGVADIQEAKVDVGKLRHGGVS